MTTIAKKQEPQITFETQLGYELYEGITDEHPEKFDSNDFSLACDTLRMSYCKDAFIVSVLTTRKVIKV